MPEKLKTNYIDHISIAVKDLKMAEEDFRQTFGGMSMAGIPTMTRRSISRIS
jgi:hypothetical protein